MAKATRKTANVEPKMTMPELAAGDETAALAAAGAQEAVMQMVPVENIRVAPGFNIRYTDTARYRAKVEEIKNSIAQEGFYQSKPLAGFVGRDGDQDVIYVTDGHRRLAAAKAAIEDGVEVPSLPVAIKPAGTSMRDLTIALHRENTGEPNTMAESAVLVKRLLRDEMGEQEIADRLGITLRYVQDCQVLIGAPKPVRELVKRDRVAGTEAVKLLRKYRLDPDKAEAEIRKMVERREARALAEGMTPAQARETRATAKDSTTGTATGRVARVPGEDEDGLDDAPTGKLRAKMRTIKTEWAADPGQVFELSEIKHIAKLIGEADWYERNEDGTTATALEPLRFKVTIERAVKQPVPVDGEDKPARRGSKRAEAARAAAMEEEDEGEPVGVLVSDVAEPVDAPATEPGGEPELAAAEYDTSDL